MTTKLTTRNPDWLNEAKDLLHQNFGAIHSCFLDAAKRAAWLGLFLNYVKERGKQDGSIPHGQFGPWLKNNLPDLNRDTIAMYMSIGRNVAEKAKIEFQKYGKSEICHRGELPEPVLKLVEGKTQYQLLPEYRQTEIKDDTLISKRGRRKGEGGASKEQREAAQQKEEYARLEAIEIRAVENTEWLLENADDKHLGLISEAARQGLLDALDTAASYLRSLKGGAK